MRWIKRLVGFRCGSGCENLPEDAPTCNEYFWTLRDAMIHYIRNHRQPRRIQVIH